MVEHRFCVTLMSDDFVWVVKRATATQPAIEYCIGLFFSGLSGSPSAVRFINKVLDCAEELRSEITAGKVDVTVLASMKKYLEIAEADGRKEVRFRYDDWQRDMDRKGFYAIASSDDLSAAEIHNLYGLRDASEKQFCRPKHRNQTCRGLYDERHPNGNPDCLQKARSQRQSDNPAL